MYFELLTSNIGNKLLRIITSKMAAFDSKGAWLQTFSRAGPSSYYFWLRSVLVPTLGIAPLSLLYMIDLYANAKDHWLFEHCFPVIWNDYTSLKWLHPCKICVHIKCLYFWCSRKQSSENELAYAERFVLRKFWR